MKISALASTFLAAVLVTAPANSRGLKPGQYEIAADDDSQQICLKSDGTWYGTTFTFGGRWINDPGSAHDRAAIYGNYQVQDHQYVGYGNDTLTVVGAGVDWYDWYDDFSHQQFFPSLPFIFLKKKCDPPSTTLNTGPATP